jgi:hypothetical protein
MREITFGMLVGIKIDGNKNPLSPLSGPFISWAKTEGGCWWWIRNGARECLSAGMIISRRFGSPEGIKKEQIFISEFPFTRYLDFPAPLRKTCSIFQDLLIEEWLNFINGDDMIREGLLTDYDILTI